MAIDDADAGDGEAGEGSGDASEPTDDTSAADEGDGLFGGDAETEQSTEEQGEQSTGEKPDDSGGGGLFGGSDDSSGDGEQSMGGETDDGDGDGPEVVKGEYTWEDYKREYFYDEEGNPPEDEEFDPAEHLGFDPEETEGRLSAGEDFASELADIVEERTVNVPDDLDEDAFFTTIDGQTTVVNRYDLEKEVPLEKKTHFEEVDRYWVNKPHAFVVIFHSIKENEKKYYVIEPYLNEIERDLKDFLSGKLKTAIKYSDDDVAVEGGDDARAGVIKRETEELLQRYDIYSGTVGQLGDRGNDEGEENFLDRMKELFGLGTTVEPEDERLEGILVRPEHAILEEDPDTLTEFQVEKLLYELRRDFVGYERIDGIKHDVNVEDISCDGYNMPVFVYHSDYEQIITNIYHGKEELDDFVVKLAQRSGKGISKRQPQVDATLPDGSRSQLTLGSEVSGHGTNYTIRQFKDVPFTPIDLINWNTFNLEEMTFLWLCIENNKSLIFAGGTASGKTTSLNAVSLFIPSNSKIVSIEDTREVELPQRNWVASVTRPSFSDDDKGDIDEFDLLEAALRQRPEYIVMGEVRGEEGRTLFQVMSTGHTTYTTFHADSVGEVIKRFTTDPINVSKTMFTALDLVSIQTQTRVRGNKVRRNKNLTEINHYEAENDEINVQDVYQWQPESDEYLKMGSSSTLEDVKFDRGWSEQRLRDELFKRKVVLAYLIQNGLNTYTEVAATIQAFINDPDTILTLLAHDKLEKSLEDLREMESVEIDVDPEKEALVPRPDPSEKGQEQARQVLDDAEDMFEEYRGVESIEHLDVADALDVEEEEDVELASPSSESDGESGTTAADGGTTDADADLEESEDESEDGL